LVGFLNFAVCVEYLELLRWAKADSIEIIW
jgi:hypothetical protein